MKAFFAKFQEQHYWLIGIGFVAILLLIPIFYVSSGFFISASANWIHLKEHLLADYFINTLWLVFSTILLSLVWAVIPAWLTARYNFPGRKVFALLLILPLSIPTYIMAFIYSGFFDVFGTLHLFLLEINPAIVYQFSIKNPAGLSLVLSLSLFPYVFLILYASFRVHQETLLEAAQTLGAGPVQLFFKIALPLARPAIAGGLFLVVMEVLNDYGAAQYFGIKTLTTGIFRTWFSIGDIQTALKLAANLLVLTLFFYFLEKILQSGKKYNTGRIQRKKSFTDRLSKPKAFAAFLVCFIPLFLGFLLPLAQLLMWAFQIKGYGLHFSDLLYNSVSLAGIVTFFCVLLALLGAFTNHYFKSLTSRFLIRLSSIGYAIPGAIIAIGVLAPLLYIDQKWVASSSLLNASIFALAYACVIRFFAVSYNAMDGVVEKLSSSYPDACKLLGVNSLSALVKVYLPLSKNGLIAGAVLVFIDVLKELPLTLILRPFNYNTFSTKAFELAGDELLKEASVPALCIVALGCVALLFVKYFTKNESL